MIAKICRMTIVDDINLDQLSQFIDIIAIFKRLQLLIQKDSYFEPIIRDLSYGLNGQCSLLESSVHVD